MENQEKKEKKSLIDWWKGLSKKTKIIVCAIAGAGVTTAVVVPVVVVTTTSSTKKSDTVDIDPSSSSNVEILSKEETTESVTITYKIKSEDYELDNIVVKVGDTTLVEGTDYTVDRATSKIILSKEAIKKYGGKAVITINVKENQKVKFFKTYKNYSETFQTSTKKYSPSKIVFKNKGALQQIDEVKITTSSNIRTATLYNSGTSKGRIAGGSDYIYDEDDTKGIKNTLKSWESLGELTYYTTTEGNTGVSNSKRSLEFNQYGYVTKYIFAGSVEYNYTYDGAPDVDA